MCVRVYYTLQSAVLAHNMCVSFFGAKVQQLLESLMGRVQQGMFDLTHTAGYADHHDPPIQPAASFPPPEALVLLFVPTL